MGHATNLLWSAPDDSKLSAKVVARHLVELRLTAHRHDDKDTNDKPCMIFSESHVSHALPLSLSQLKGGHASRGFALILAEHFLTFLCLRCLHLRLCEYNPVTIQTTKARKVESAASAKGTSDKHSNTRKPRTHPALAGPGRKGVRSFGSSIRYFCVRQLCRPGCDDISHRYWC